MDKNSSQTLQNIGNLITIALPFVQLFFQWLPEQLKGLFLFGDATLLFVSLVTLVFSIILMLMYKTRPFYEVVLFERLSDSTNKQNTEGLEQAGPKRYWINLRIEAFAILIGLIAVVFALLFLLVGLHGIISVNRIIFQTVCYIAMISLAVLSITIFTQNLQNQTRWLELSRQKITKAISLALQHNAIPEIPPVHFKEVVDDIFMNELRVLISVTVSGQNKDYVIRTDSAAEVLFGVNEFQNKS